MILLSEESNLRHSDLESDVLPAELTGFLKNEIKVSNIWLVLHQDYQKNSKAQIPTVWTLPKPKLLRYQLFIPSEFQDTQAIFGFTEGLNFIKKL